MCRILPDEWDGRALAHILSESGSSSALNAMERKLAVQWMAEKEKKSRVFFPIQS